MAILNGGDGDDILTGGTEHDTIRGNGGADTISGGSGNDVLIGGTGGDLINGDGGDDQLYSYIIDPAFGGSLGAGISYDVFAEVDVLNGGAGDDYIFAGFGDFVDGGSHGTYGDRLYISFLGATAGVQADFRVVQAGGTLTIGGATIQNITNIGYLEGSNFDDLLVPIDTYYPTGANVYGRGGNDQIIAGYYSGWGGSGLYGGDGDDTIDARTAQYIPNVYGDAGNDIIYGASAWSISYGGSGDDTIYTSANAWGGTGDDSIVLSYGSYGTTAHGEAGNDVIDASAAGAVLASGGAGADTITGSGQADTIHSADAPPQYSTPYSTDNAAELDSINGGAGDDIISIGYGDSADGGAGADIVRLSLAGFGSGIVFSTAGIASGQPAANGAGTIQNIETLDYLTGTAFNDVLTLATQSSLLTVDASDGDDLIIAGGSSTRVYGGAGNDRFVSGPAGDIFDGGVGAGDTVSFQNLTSGVSVTLATGGFATGPGGDQYSNIENFEGSIFSDALTGNNSANVLSGGAGFDTLSGNGGNDILNGGSDADTLLGGAGIDALYGDAGDDILDGGAGNDGLFGGDGNDRIVYDAADNPLYVNGGAGVDTLVIWNESALTTYDLAGHGFEGAEVITPDTAGREWTTITTNYDVNWSITGRTVHNDDGSRIVATFDPSNMLNTSAVFNSFDTAGRLTDIDMYFDDGTRTFINVDEANSQPWSQNWFTFDAQGRLDSQDVLNDDGSHTFINYDQDNSQSWSQAWFTYDSQGRLDTQDIVNDDGGHIFYNYDQAGTEAFEWNAYLYDSTGTAYEQVVRWDDGSTAYYTL